MEKQLGQSGIDALFSAAMAQNESVLHELDAPELYNFKRAGQISSEQLKAISTLNDQFARNLMHTLGGWLRMHFDVKLVAGEQLTYGEFVSRLGKPTYMCSIRVEPFDALGLMEIELSLALPVVDVLLGGVGQAAEVRELTDIEEEVFWSVVQMIVQELNVAWQQVGLELLFEKREMEDKVLRIMTAGEKTLCMSFEVRMPEAQGVVNLCLPASIVNAILRRMVAEGDRPRRRSKEARGRMRELVSEVVVGGTVQFPPLRLRVRELATLEPGTLLRLPLAAHCDAELRVGGLMFSRAHIVSSGEHKGGQLIGDASLPVVSTITSHAN